MEKPNFWNGERRAHKLIKGVSTNTICKKLVAKKDKIYVYTTIQSI